ncbi:DUF4062 domain-containing protein [Serratia fonticola]|uniref:DUF4062 domain-containing protein n=1 Tax=Serratia fonticola TaxID=47917 RepID=UPI00217AF39D|nr:DUF4062 domain-containing protein [Serratia fonticola]CAI0759065.1 Uncharacterised protein [Serratia fonticola]
MDDKKYQVFVSSTYKDLYNARKKVIEAILSIYHFPVGMEMFSADDSEQWEIIKETIDASDYYIVIIGHRYGALSDEDISYTEKEYRYAKEIGVPVLAFIRSRKVLLTDDDRESDPKIQKKLDKFISLAQESKMCDFWETPDELVTKVAIALPKIFKRTPRVGWIRSSGGLSKETIEELARLSNENRMLRERVVYLERDVTLDSPNLIVKLNEDANLSLNLQPDYEPITIPKELSITDIPDEYLEFVSQESIDKYNASFPSEDEVRKYNEQCRFYFRAKNNSIQINTEIKNIGRVSASNVSVDVEFPNFVYVMSCSELNKLNSPNKILPVNPITTARARKSLRDLRSGNFSSTFGQIEDVDSIGNKLSSIFELPNIHGVNSWSNIQDGVVEFYEKKIMHTKTAYCDSIIIVPLKSGEGVVKVNIICEEYKEAISLELPIIVK